MIRGLPELITDHADEGMVGKKELTHIADCIEKSVKKDGDWVVEIGSYYGATTSFIARVLQRLPTKGHKVISIDAFQQSVDLFLNGKGIYGKMVDTLVRWGVERDVVPITGFSQEVCQFLQPGFSFLAIDGSHRYEDTRFDIMKYGELLAPGGYMWIHDCWLPYKGVLRAVLEAKERLPWFEIQERYKRDVVVRKV